MDYRKERKNFFEQITLKSGLYDTAVAKRVYFAIVKTIVKECRKNGCVNLPQWGEFKVIMHKSRRYRNVNSKKFEFLPDLQSLKFTPCRGLKYYIQNMKNTIPKY